MTRTLKPVAVLVLMASLATCRLDKLITPSTADIRLSLAADTVGIADSVRLVAVVTVDGKQNQALRVEWSTSAPDTATVDSSGLVRGILRGRATITARVENALFLPAPISDTAVLSVVVPRVTIAPDSTTLTSVGDSVCLTAVALDAGGGTVPGVAVAFAVTADPDTTLTQRATPGCYGARKGGAPARVRAFVDIAADTATVTVRQVAATLTVTPDSIRFYTQTRQRTLSAAAIDSGGSPIPAPSIVWTSADTNVAPVAPTGTVTARSNGTTWVHAQSGTARDSTRVVVQQVAASIAVAPGSDTLQTVRGRDTLFATVRDSADRVIGAASPVWTSLSPDSVRIVTYGGNSATIEAVAEGSATIVAQDTVGGQVLTATAQVTVRYQIVSLQISPAAATLVAIGDTVRFTATGRDANDSIVAQPRAAWRAADTLRVRIDSVTGLATARNPGATNVIARRDAVADTAAATVTPPVLSVDTMAFVDSMLRSSPDSVSVIRTVGNTGAGTLGAHLAIVHGASWLSVTPDTVNIPASGSTSIRLTARAGSLSEATYFDTVRVQSAVAAGSPKNIPVRFTVYCPLVTIAPDTAHAAGLAASDCGARHQAGSFADYYRFTGVAGDTIRIAMTTSPTSIDTYLYLLDGAGAVVASNDNCPGALNSCLQFVVPAAGPYTIEATSFTAGAAFPYTLGLTHPRAPAAPTALGQFANDTMIAVGDSANTGTIEFRATGQDVNPRDTLRLQVEVRRLAAGFTGAPTDSGAARPNAGGGVALTAMVSGLTHDSSYHWRARVVDQTGRAGSWTAFGGGPGPDFTVFITTPVLTVTPTTIDDAALFGSTAVHPFTVQIRNTGTGTFTWSATESSSWITVGPASGSPGAVDTIYLHPSGLAAGTYTDTVTVTAPGAIGSPVKIVVTFEIQQPVLVVTPDSVSRSTNFGSGATFFETLRIANSGNGTLSWNATHNPAKTWLSFARTSGGAPDSIPLTIMSTGLAAGTYRDTVVVDAGTATGSPRSIPVTLTVHQPLLAVSPAAIQDSANVADTVDRRRTLYVTNTDGGTLTWTASKTTAWVTLSKTSGGGASDSLVVTLQPDTLSGVVHRDTIVFMSPEANNDPIKVPVVFDILQPVLSVTPGAIVDSAAQLDSTPRVHTLTVANTGRGTLIWTAADDTTWITVSPPSDTGGGAVTVTLRATNLAVGTHTGRVVVTSLNATGSPATTLVTFKITPPPLLSVSPSSRADTAFQGSALAKSFVLHIANTGPGSLNWSALTDTTWLTRSKASGSAPPTDSTIVTLTPGSLAAGTHNGTVTVTAPGAAGSPATVPVSFVIRPCLEPAVLPDTVISGSVTLSDCAAPRRANSLAKLYSVQATAGDTLSFRLTAAFDAYLVLTDSLGNSLRQNDECTPEVGTACIKNYPVTVTGRYIVQATTAVAGATGAFTLSVVRERAPSLPQSIGQFRNDSTAIGLTVTILQDTVVFKTTLNDPNPLDSVRAEIEVVPRLSPFSGTPTHLSPFVPVSPTGVRVTVRAAGPAALPDDTPFHWRTRTCDRTTRCSTWLAFANNPDTTHFRVAVPQAPNVPTSLGQFQADGSTSIGLGQRATGLTVILKGTVTDPDAGDVLRLVVEVKTTGTAFDSTGLLTATGLTNNGQGQVSQGVFILTDYHWRAQTCDQTNRCSAWVSFPQPVPNPETDADFRGPLIATSPPASAPQRRR